MSQKAAFAINSDQYPELAKILSGDLDLIESYFFSIIGKFHLLKANCDIAFLADDICQDSFLTIQENKDKGYLVGIKNEKGYIYRIIKNKIINEHERICKLTGLMVKDEYSGHINFIKSLNFVDEINPEIYCSSRYIKKALWDAIRKLTPRHQLIVLLRYWKDMEYKKMGKILGGCTSNCIGATLTYIRLRLNLELSNKLG